MSIISVVIPAYNAERTILETVESVLQQTFEDFELIVIDDGSTDQTVALLQTIQDPRLKIFSYPNAGLSTARNRGIARSTGGYITFLDSDDLWSPDKLELQLKALQENPKAGLAYSWTYNMTALGDQLFATPKFLYQGYVYPQLLVQNFLICGSNCLIRRSAIDQTGEFDPTLKAYEDWDYWLRLATHSTFVVVPKYQIFYRRSPGSMSSNIDNMEKACWLVVEKVFQSVPPELQSLKSQALASNYRYFAILGLPGAPDQATVQKAGRHLWRAISYSPKMLLEFVTYRFLVKWFLMTLLSPQVARSLSVAVRSTMRQLQLNP